MGVRGSSACWGAAVEVVVMIMVEYARSDQDLNRIATRAGDRSHPPGVRDQSTGKVFWAGWPSAPRLPRSLPGHGDLQRAVGGLHPHRRGDRLQRPALAVGQVAGEDDVAGPVADHDVGARPWWRSAPPAPGRPARGLLLFGPAEPLSRGGGGVSSTGLSMTSRATDQASTSVITAAISTDQFGPPRVPRMEPLAPVASSASNTRRGLIGASAYRSSYDVSSGAASTPSTRASVRRWPRA